MPNPKAPDILVELTLTVIPEYNTYKFGRYYDAHDHDWPVLTSTNFLLLTSTCGLISAVTELVVQPECS